MMVAFKRTVKICLILLFAGSLREVDCYSETNGIVDLYYQPAQESNNVLASSSQYEITNDILPPRSLDNSPLSPIDTNSIKYLFKFLNSDGYSSSASLPLEQKRFNRLRELLETLDPRPIYRSSRTYPTFDRQQFLRPQQIEGSLSSSAANFVESNAIDQQQHAATASSDSIGNNRATANNNNNKNVNQFRDRSQQIKTQPILGISWLPTRGSNSQSTYAKPTNSNAALVAKSNPRHPIGNEEVAFSTPIHAISDYEWKRVENTRWNNLRGMWGKRSVGGSGNKLALPLNNKAQEEPQKVFVD